MFETQLPWGPSARFVKVICSLGLVIPDGTDVDHNADLTTQGGKVTIVCNATKVRLIPYGEPGRMLSLPSAPFTIAPATGELFDTQGVMGLYVLDPMSGDIDPQGFTYTATVVPNVGSSWSVTFGGNSVLPDVVDLVRLASIAPATGVSTLEQRIEALEAGGGSGAYPVQQVALTGNLAYTLPVGAPADRVIPVVFTQDGTGGHPVTYGGQPVSVDLTAGASTAVEFYPVGAGYVVRYSIAGSAAANTAQREVLGVGSLSPSPLGGLTVEAMGATPRAIAEFGGYVWGANSTGAVSRSTDDGATWEAAFTIPGSPYVRRLLPTSDGEVIALAQKGIYKSTGWAGGSPTWALKQAPNGVCDFLHWSIDGDGTRFITTEYSSASRVDSRYVRMSFDAGETWQVVYDSVAVHGETLGNNSHLHGCCYDPRGDRWYFTEGHDDGGSPGDIAGVYCSTDNGATWTRPAAMAQNPGPTVLVATPEGLVCGSDYVDNGIYGVHRDDPSKQALVPVWRWRTGRPGLVGFANSGRYDPRTGLVYMSWTTAFADVAPIITAATVTTGDVVLTWPTLPVANSDAIRDVLPTRSGRILSHAGIGGAGYSITADVALPGSGRAVSLHDTSAVLGGTATDGGSLAVGRSATTGTFPTSTAVGQKATAGSGTNGAAVAVGASAQAVDQGTALGALTKATGLAGALAVGRAAEALGNQSTAVGTGAKASGNLGVALGNGSVAAVLGASLGSNAETGTGAVAVGYGAKALNPYSVAIGRDTATTADYQVHVGPRHVALAPPASVPSAPPNGARVYTRLNGNSKHELVVQFPTGAVQVIATEP